MASCTFLKHYAAEDSLSKKLCIVFTRQSIVVDRDENPVHRNERFYRIEGI